MSQVDPKSAKEQLISAGIGDRFAEMELSSFGELGTRFLNAFAPANVKTVKPILRKGFLAYFNGTGSREFALTLAGGLLLVYSPTVHCLHLSTLSDLLDNRETERLQELIDSDLLVVTEFLNTSSISPLSPRSIFRVESFLLERTETYGKSLILTGDGKLSQTQWWTPRMTTRIVDSFIQETVSSYAYPTASKI